MAKPNFKQPKKTTVKDSGDGFISPKRLSGFDSDNHRINNKFSHSYRPDNSNRSGSSGRKVSSSGTSPRRIDGSFGRTDSLGSGFNLNEDVTPKQVQQDSSNKKSIFRRFSLNPSQKKLVRGFSISMVALLLGVGSLFAYGFLKARSNIFKGDGEGAAALQENVDPARLNGEGDGRINILLLGKGGPGHEAPDLTDTILIASIDPVQNEAALLSVPRDLFVETPSGGGTKINAVYSNAKSQAQYNGTTDADSIENAGLNAIKDKVSEVVGIPMHYYIMVNFDAFQRAIDTVGGVTIDVEEALYDPKMARFLGGSSLVADEGLQTFDGQRALLYSRSRNSARSDFDRTERQREVIVALQQKILNVGTFSNPLKVIDLLDNLGDNVRTDLNGLGEVKRLYEIGQNIGPDSITSLGLADAPNILVETGFVSGQSIVLPIDGLYQYDSIQDYVRNTLRDPYLKRENARVTILNGTDTPGLATAKEKELKSFGYNVVSIGDAPTGSYARSLLFNTSAEPKPYTESYLTRRVGLSISSQSIAGLPDVTTTDFVIILGQDEALKTTNN